MFLKSFFLVFFSLIINSAFAAIFLIRLESHLAHLMVNTLLLIFVTENLAQRVINTMEAHL